ncbi:hypothetical protein ANTHELSMS3_01178 [Antarctobacter heliothermus]|uniref:Uncharacterized protein n=1 Tax=Antarctobacter heliothermus TaxID=74033 RepID=A0A222E165_9RHOB|nr:hypothetical protein ANTHELSMS3_01178 [Antarctobacter heliothermus]
MAATSALPEAAIPARVELSCVNIPFGRKGAVAEGASFHARPTLLTSSPPAVAAWVRQFSEILRQVVPSAPAKAGRPDRPLPLN